MKVSAEEQSIISSEGYSKALNQAITLTSLPRTSSEKDIVSRFLNDEHIDDAALQKHNPLLERYITAVGRLENSCNNISATTGIPSFQVMNTVCRVAQDYERPKQSHLEAKLGDVYNLRLTTAKE